MIQRRVVINVVAFLALSAVLIAVLMVNIFRIQPRYTVVAAFPNAGGAFTGQEVTYRGVTVGRIGDMRVASEGVELDLIIDSSFDRIPRDTRARIMFKSAVGEQFVDLLPQTRQPPFLEDGDLISLDRTEVPVQQEELLRLLSAVLDGVPPEALGNLVDTLGTGLGGRGSELHRLLAAFDPVSEVLARRTAELNRINVNADRAGAAFSGTSREFVSGVGSLATVAETFASRSEDIERLLAAGASGLPDLAGLLAARKAELNTTIANLAELTRMNFEHIDSVRDTLEWLPLFLQTIIDIYDPETNRLRFGLSLAEGSEPCDYGTPRRAPDERTGNAPHHPVIDFECEGAGGSSAGAAADPAAGPGARGSGRADPEIGWLDLLTDTLPTG